MAQAIVYVVDDDKGLVPVQTVRCYPEGFVGRDHPENLGKRLAMSHRALRRPQTAVSRAAQRSNSLPRGPLPPIPRFVTPSFRVTSSRRAAILLP